MLSEEFMDRRLLMPHLNAHAASTLGSSDPVWFLWLALSAVAIAAGGCLFSRRRRPAREPEIAEDDLAAAVRLSLEPNEAVPLPPVPGQQSGLLRENSPPGGHARRPSSGQVSPAELFDIEAIAGKKREMSAASLFQLKRDWLTRELARVRQARGGFDGAQGARHLQIIVRREFIFQDSYLQFARIRDEALALHLSVHFVGEEGRDDGGVTRDWFSALSREIFNPDYALFAASCVDDYTYQINPASGVNPDHLEFFQFVGLVVGKALTDGCLLDAHFTRLFYKRLLGKGVAYEDMASVDLQFYHSLCWILEHDLEGQDLGLTFTVGREHFGSYEEVELKEGGAQESVGEHNKREYVDLVSAWRLSESVDEQFQALRAGLSKVLDPSLLQHFDEAELEWLIGGLPTLDAADWRKNTVYKSGYSDTPDCLTIQWFWQLVEMWDQEMRARLLQFVTGTSKVPYPDGFKGLKGSDGLRPFHIVRISDFTRLPQAHTCFNELILPEYSTIDELASNLHTAIFETGNQFQLR